ncbi:hypothetical protein STAS_17588 [Striga asiatica]|uniref:Uncharacterized protein n=1 Tax=Striga asiatica TaxID=4170 RepID=A0A5A7Q6Q6_STRAF|nr:hypothetical protein STAS_17588 [Striga asiatica]
MDPEEVVKLCWKKQLFEEGLFYEGSEELEFDVLKKLEKRKAEELGFTLSSIEKLGLLSKAEELGLLSLLKNSVGFSPSALASMALSVLVAAVAVVVLVPDDSVVLVAAQAVVAGSRAVCLWGPSCSMGYKSVKNQFLEQETCFLFLEL